MKIILKLKSKNEVSAWSCLKKDHWTLSSTITWYVLPSKSTKSSSSLELVFSCLRILEFDSIPILKLIINYRKIFCSKLEIHNFSAWFIQPKEMELTQNWWKLDCNYLDTGMDNSLNPRLRTGNVPAIERLVKLAFGCCIFW